jgi:hypothetical protein
MSVFIKHGKLNHRFIYFYLFLCHTSTFLYLNGNKDLDHIFYALAVRYRPCAGVQPPELMGPIYSEL